MKYVCSKCGRYTIGSRDSVIKKGWVLSTSLQTGKEQAICPICLEAMGGSIAPTDGPWAHTAKPVRSCPRCGRKSISVVQVGNITKNRCNYCGWVW